MSKAFADSGQVPEFELTSFFAPGRIDVEYDPGGPSMTRQEFTEECDINVLMKRYEKAGTWPLPPNGAAPVYYDFTEVPGDLMDSMELMMEAEAAFMKLPAVVRKEFDNDAMRFVEYASDVGNLERMREWGLAEPEKAPDPPMRVEVVNPAPAGSSSSAGSADG